MRAQVFVASYFDAWNHRDPRAVASHLAPGGYYRDVPENAKRTRTELVISLNTLFAEFPLRADSRNERPTKYARSGLSTAQFRGERTRSNY